ncbi:unnamed protein product [Phytophthora lilii]|uniref:Unnamed protein product n=1 Tax=Phytophthora lilii TaxID=2077276 RepID=A0A9W6YH16_9STRA|nr:unnamed protein product [Phytophthora lilii]
MFCLPELINNDFNKRDMEEWDRREREAALQDSESTKDTTEEVEAEPDYPQEQNKQVSGDDEEEAEAVPVIPGLTDVELFAFNAEFATEEVLDKIIDWSYDQVALMSRYRDNYISTSTSAIL